jgi:hypothetical protein
MESFGWVTIQWKCRLITGPGKSIGLIYGIELVHIGDVKKQQ